MLATEVIVFCEIAEVKIIRCRQYFQDKIVVLDFWKNAFVVSHVSEVKTLSRNNSVVSFR